MFLPHNLFDGPSILIVVGGTCAATALRCGTSDLHAAATALGQLVRPGFKAREVRAELAVQVREIREDGVLRAEHHHVGDAEFDEATDALIGTRSLEALHTAHLAHKRRRMGLSRRAIRTFTQAADLSPVLGLAGTLISLTQLPAQNAAGGDGDFTGAISMAVLTTLYGLLLGNLVFAPLARAVARRAGHEEAERQALLDWLEVQLAGALPPVGVGGHALGHIGGPAGGRGR